MSEPVVMEAQVVATEMAGEGPNGKPAIAVSVANTTFKGQFLVEQEQCPRVGDVFEIGISRKEASKLTIARVAP